MESERQGGIVPHAITRKRLLPVDITDTTVLEQLGRIRSSPPFRSSRRCQSFLDYVIQAAVEGRIDSLKERTIGVEVFSRDPDYDTNQDPVVRGTATEVRKRLAQYYQIPGNERQVRIDLRSGSYLPEFHLPTEAVPVYEPRGGLRARWWLFSASVLTAIIVAAVVILIPSHPRTPQSVVDQFWAPVIAGSSPVLLCLGQPKVYHFLEPLETQITKKLPGPGQPRISGAPANEKVTMTLGQVIPMWDRYIAIGDAICLSDMAGLLTQKGRVYHIRGEASTSFADLRENPTVLIGAFTNDWTRRLMGELRFTLERDANLGSPHVHDRLNPSNRDWQLTNEWPDWKMPVDYAIVSRVLDTSTGRVVLMAGGITQYGTAAAGEFLTNSDYFSHALQQAPADWQRKNIQVVLATKVIGGTAGPPTVLAAHFW